MKRILMKKTKYRKFVSEKCIIYIKLETGKFHSEIKKTPEILICCALKAPPWNIRKNAFRKNIKVF